MGAREGRSHATSREPHIADLRAESQHAARRLALYRRRIYIGRADGARLAEYERIAQGAAERLQRAERREDNPGGEPHG